MKKKIFGLLVAVGVMAPCLANAEETEKLVKIGESSYATLKEAVDSVEVCEDMATCDVTTINVLGDTETPGIVFLSGKNIIIDLGGFTVTFKEPTVGSKGTQTQDMQILANSEITIKNGNLVSSDTDSSKMFIQNYANLTLKDVNIDATNELNQYAVSNNSGVVSIEGTTSIKTNAVAFDVYGWYGSYANGPQVTVNTTGTIEGDIEVTTDGKTATKELSLVIKNINHIGEMFIQSGLEDNVTVEMQDSNLYEVVISDDKTTYVVATDDEVIDMPYIEDAMFGEDFEKQFAELDEMINELSAEIEEIEASGVEVPEELVEYKDFLISFKRAFENKVEVSSYNILYGSFINDKIVVGQEEKQPNEKVSVTLDIPTTVEKVKEGYTRKYVVIRLHENEIENEDGTFDYKYEVAELAAKDNGNGTVTFETDKFSTYFLAYEDVKTTTNPGTFDGISLYMTIASVSLVGLVAISLYAKKKLFN